ncbi:MAG: hypothetical protein R3E42_07965 [Burkholderiaceae bacterium]
MERLTGKRLMQNELYDHDLPTGGERETFYAAISRDINVLQKEQKAYLEKIYELVGNVEALLQDYSPYQLESL